MWLLNVRPLPAVAAWRSAVVGAGTAASATVAIADVVGPLLPPLLPSPPPSPMLVRGLRPRPAELESGAAAGAGAANVATELVEARSVAACAEVV